MMESFIYLTCNTAGISVDCCYIKSTIYNFNESLKSALSAPPSPHPPYSAQPSFTAIHFIKLQ